ncbi:hypothetical protein TTHERM_000835149 (macronuclear) [Tetrahymena thermophila SB210]|uniref:Uncharacterized protein n=1 Tax=Tetrahymena thermophila (strain SB210) TaxID=312017 RepID=W7XL25_TETTS|nr:hypothetical protein TTHERM_000835149 [Tetrahymena thermophila SB210]EWS75549.1 hypothetical protein TTHERM_000835149 [Tetrahymena thermophila SB210]|eukprot:XP_012651915.1 hypothetical protein TTHERM_000835149 [Tetrahymena thermophila SB210]
MIFNQIYSSIKKRKLFLVKQRFLIFIYMKRKTNLLFGFIFDFQNLIILLQEKSLNQSLIN